MGKTFSFKYVVRICHLFALLQHQQNRLARVSSKLTSRFFILHVSPEKSNNPLMTHSVLWRYLVTTHWTFPYRYFLVHHSRKKTFFLKNCLRPLLLGARCERARREQRQKSRWLFKLFRGGRVEQTFHYVMRHVNISVDLKMRNHMNFFLIIIV